MVKVKTDPKNHQQKFWILFRRIKRTTRNKEATDVQIDPRTQVHAESKTNHQNSTFIKILLKKERGEMGNQ